MFEIVAKKALNPTVVRMTISAPLIARKAEPGQFVIVRAGENSERIPLTVADYDREAGTVSVSYDFGEYRTAQIPENMRGGSMTGESGLIIGQDVTKAHDALPATIDDLVIVNGVLTADDIASLAEYYGVK